MYLSNLSLRFGRFIFILHISDKDIVFLGVIVGAFASLVSLILVGVTMCQRYPSKLTVLIEIIILFFGGKSFFKLSLHYDVCYSVTVKLK